MNKKILIFVGIILIFLSGCKKIRTTGTAFDGTLAESIQATGTTFDVQRIVALSPAAAEILFEVGAGNQVVAVSEFTDYPAEAVNLPIVGGFDGKTLSIESILSFKPDFVYMTNGMHNFMISQMEEYGIKYYLSNADSIEGIEKEILDIGGITGHLEQAQKVVEKMEEKLFNLSVKKEKVPVYYEVWNSPYMTCGYSSFINDVLSIAGFENVFSDIKEAYPIVSEESIIARNPKIIFITKSSGMTVDAVNNRYGWENISAIKNNKIIVVDDNILSRSVPRVIDEICSIYEKEL